MIHTTRSSLPLPLLALLVIALASLTGCGPRSLGSYEPVHHEQPDASPMGPEDAGVSDAHDAGSEPPPAECTHDGQCEDGDPCNGLQACRANRCVQVAPACAGEDDEACDRCVAIDARHCITQARDGDGDGHRSAACVGAQEPGDDCDDQRASVHPQAMELCDGLDNDCDGSLDLEDGLTLAGEAHYLLDGRYPAVAWSSAGVHGLVYEQTGIQYAALDAEGKVMGAPGLVADVPDHFDGVFRPALSAGHGEFAITWSRDHELGFRRFTPSGMPVGEAVAVASSEPKFRGAQPAALGESDWLVVFEGFASASAEDSMLKARRIDGHDSAVGVVETLVGEASNLSGVRSLGERLGIVWSRQDYAAGSSSISWAGRAASDSAAQPAIDLASMGGTGLTGPAVIAAGHEGYAVVWHEVAPDSAGTRRMRFVELDSQGNLRCGPVNLTPHFAPDSGLIWPHDMVASDDGFLVAALAVPNILNTASGVDLIELRSGCRFAQRFRVADSWGNAYPRLSRADDGKVVVVWQYDKDGPDTIQERVLPARFCK
jgi:hypothetical protein